ncbi:ABC transporter ATP-binding protein/permease [bacterium]|nr:ABC transporter ATP-binding protein/permease [bacterium]
MEKRHEKNFDKGFDKSIWTNVIQMLKPYRTNYAVTFGVIVLLAGVEVMFPLVVRHAIDDGITLNNSRIIYQAVAMYIVLIIAQSLLVAMFIAQCSRVGARVMSDLRKKMFEHLQALSVSYFDKTPVGWIMSRMFSDSQRVGETLTWGAVDFVWGIVNMLLMAIAMLFVNWKLALAVLSLIPLIMAVSFVFQKKLLHTYRRVRKINSDITAGYSEGFSGFRVIKSLVREKAVTDEFFGLTRNMYEESVRSAVLSSMYLPIIHIIGALGSALVIGFGGSGVIAGSITLGTLVAFISYTHRFFEPANEIARIFGQLQETQASAERMFSLLAVQPEVREKLTTSDQGSVKGLVEFEKIWFAYDKKKYVVQNFSLKVEPGETIALVGATGGGKTTVVNLLMRFYDPSRGSILIDGENIRNWSFKKLRSSMGVILQTPHLFSGSLMDNIRYGRLDASDEEIVEASRLSGLHEFVQNFPEGYKTVLREGGEPLSTGQKQLVSMARAVLTDPPIFIMDEATSSIDTETERRIQVASEKILKDKTAFIIAHRLTTIRGADRILVINKGRLAEIGTHDELMRNKKFYHKLYTQQFMVI